MRISGIKRFTPNSLAIATVMLKVTRKIVTNGTGITNGKPYSVKYDCSRMIWTATVGGKFHSCNESDEMLDFLNGYGAE